MSSCCRCLPCCPVKRVNPMMPNDESSYGSTHIGEQPLSPRSLALKTLNGAEVPVSVSFIFPDGTGVKYREVFKVTESHSTYQICNLVRDVATPFAGVDKMIEQTSQDTFFLSRDCESSVIQFKYGVWKRTEQGSFMQSFKQVRGDCDLQVETAKNKNTTLFRVVEPKTFRGISGKQKVSMIAIEFFPLEDVSL